MAEMAFQLRWTLFMACLAQATAVRYNAASADVVRQRMIDAQSIDR